ncbi:hypothetical protein O7598_15045 [Micromonospora sp. WMMC241]|uniref:hypothetical protein n=1 Tax=Micromonospora sp. WMMC241 TaxID=3015159 RepID=UPI0022B70AEF|nr:hypothetical protein [Micromonospora sp. WMMC241]MCZ7437722.1 hypothetical protein [Micromonospora sp. WMMC241]
MDDPLMLAAATTLVGWTTTNLAEGARSAVNGLTEFLRRRFRGEASTRELVDAALDRSSPDSVRRFAVLLDQEMLRDPGFEAELRARFERVQVVVTAHQGDVTNLVSGDVSGSVVQARDVRGGISFGNGPS